MTNAPTPAAETMIEVTDRDTVQCRNLQSFCNHPKFQQFLRLFNAHRKGDGQDTGITDVTVEELMRDPRIAERASEFFQSLQLSTTPMALAHIHRIADNAATLIEERRKLFAQLNKTETDTFPCLLEQR